MKFRYYEIRPCVDFGNRTESFRGTTFDDPCFGAHHTWEAALEEAEFHALGRPVFWTLYGVHETSTAIGDFKTFNDAYKVMQAILLPMREACARHYDAELDDICNQSTTEERL